VRLLDGLLGEGRVEPAAASRWGEIEVRCRASPVGPQRRAALLAQISHRSGRTVGTSNIAGELRPLAVPLVHLEGLPGNPRKGDVQAIARSYAVFGQRKPVVARRQGERDGKPTGIVLAGNHQLQAAQELGWDELAVVWVDDDELTAKAFALADNRTGELGGEPPWVWWRLHRLEGKMESWQTPATTPAATPGVLTRPSGATHPSCVTERCGWCWTPSSRPANAPA
jgi:hypothetical protein